MRFQLKIKSQNTNELWPQRNKVVSKKKKIKKKIKFLTQVLINVLCNSAFSCLFADSARPNWLVHHKVGGNLEDQGCRPVLVTIRVQPSRYIAPFGF